MIFYCKAGHCRGGHFHDCDEMIVLLSGKMRYHKWIDGKEEITYLAEGETSYNPAGVPHMGEFLEDSWIIDWKVGDLAKSQIGGFITTNFEPFREQVRRSIAS